MKTSSKPKIIFITDKLEPGYIKSVLGEGVDGIVSNLYGKGELKKAIIETIENGKYFDENILLIIEADSKNISKLTEIEIKVYNYLQQGLDYIEIASKLFKSPHTIRRHMQNMMDKLGVKSMPELKSMVKYPYNIS